MRIIILLSFVVSLASCGGSGSAVSKQLADSDSLVINFNAPQTDSIVNTVTTTEAKAIKKLTDFVDGKTAEAYKCGYDGNIMFYKKGVLQGDVSFNYSGDGCHHFIMLLNDKLTPTAMRNEAADFLKNLAEGKGSY